MSFTIKGAAVAACGTLLLAGLTIAPAAAATPGAVTLNLRYGGVSRTVEVHGVDTVAGALAQLKLEVDADDVVAPGLTTTLSDGLDLVVDVVSTKTSTKKVTLKYSTIKTATKKLYKGDSKVVKKGRNGKAIRTYLTTTVNGESSTVVIKEKITKKVINKKVLVGSNDKRAINLARLAKWNKIAKCESGGRWHINTGNGYYGGLQFNLATWRSVKGQHFAKYPHKASKAEQITVANRLYEKRGFKPWSCRRVL
ncbi:MAG: transglycosylase family protein [Micropruina sp.]|uniref:transglycosylase family protein n=1 Tax=Micropruina sp. TaxID=2737536 RepID=UPI0039E2F639